MRNRLVLVLQQCFVVWHWRNIRLRLLGLLYNGEIFVSLVVLGYINLLFGRILNLECVALRVDGLAI